jgi:putative lipoic acid-binding regulatory protein|tara:strand:+ start:129 stop:392 length:264 start_codon:yes stop_codon:yes gene_type:complete
MDFDSLRERLEEISYPSVYMFKFIVKSDLNKIAQIESLFQQEKAEIIRKESSKGAFISISIKEVMLSADEIISVYEKASSIDGVITL